MSTALPPTGQTATTAVPKAGSESRINCAVIIYGRMDFMTLGSIIVTAQSFAGRVYVLPDREDPKITRLAELLGAIVMNPGRADGFIDALFASAGAIVALYGDGTHDPAEIPVMINLIKDGSDLIVGTSTYAERFDEKVRLLNRRSLSQADTGYIASSGRCMHKFRLRPDIDLSKQMMEHAVQEHALIKRLDLNNNPSSLRRHRIGVVVPAYNEEALLDETINGIPGYVSHIYVIDDCSRDRTPIILRRLASENPRVTGLIHEVNKGVGATIIDGYRMAVRDGMDYVAVMAGDNQMDPTELHKLLMPVIEDKTDYAKGNRLLNKQMRKGMSNWRFFGNSMLTMLNKIASGYWNITDPQNGYTVISRRALETLDLDSIYTYYGYCNDMLVKLNTVGLRTLDVPIPARYGQEKSKIRYSRFIFKVAPMLFRGFLWRLRVKYTVLDFHPLVLFYMVGMVLLPVGMFFGMISLGLAWLLGPGAVAPIGLFGTILGLAGLQSLLSAIALDAQVDQQARAQYHK
ncbi:MAG TPA: glycosyltransferase [Methanocella sp.]|nr:glycosyltransferase [Methanocella sp.]